MASELTSRKTILMGIAAAMGGRPGLAMMRQAFAGFRKLKAWLPKADNIARVVFEGEGTAITGPATRRLSGASAQGCRWSRACPSEGGGEPAAGPPVCPIDGQPCQDRRG